MDDRQMKLSDALKLIEALPGDSYFDIHCRMIDSQGKYNAYYSDALADSPELTIPEFIEQTDNYGSFWLSIKGGNFIQLVDDKGEVL